MNLRNRLLLGLRVFNNHIYKKYRVYLSLRLNDNLEEIYIEKIINQSTKGNGKEAILKLFEYSKNKRYKTIRIRVYPLNKAIGESTYSELFNLVNFYRKIGFKDVNDFLNEKSAFEMVYTIS